MPDKKPRAPFGPIQLGAYDCPNIPNGELHRARGRPLGLTRNVVYRPAEGNSDGRINTRSGEDRRCVGYPWPTASEEHYVPNDGQCRTADGEWRSQSCLLREHCGAHGQEECGNVGRGRE